MTLTLFAQPYDISATGFFFKDVQSYARQAAAVRNDYGQPVEEFEIQVIDGDPLDVALANALRVYQCDIGALFDKLDNWDAHQKRLVIVAVGEVGLTFDLKCDDPEDLDIDLTPCESMRDFAEICVEEGWFGEIPKALEFYIDHDAIARDLSLEYSEITIAGETFIYRAG